MIAGITHIIRRITPLLLILLLSWARLANAQSGSAYFAGGTATDSAVGPIDTFGAGIIYNSPALGGLFETIGGDLMIAHHLGVGAEVSFRDGRGAYAGLAYSPKIYDINAVYRPSENRRFVPEFQAGLGRLALKLYDTPQFCSTYSEGCSSNTGAISSDDHWQLHASGGLRFYVFKGLFIRPQVDLHWVDHFYEFGSSWVPEYSAAIGYTFPRGR